MSDKPSSSYFQDLVQKSKDSQEKDPYAIENFGESKKKPSRLLAKWNRLKSTFVGKEGFSEKFIQGFKMGGIVGGIFGSLSGIFAAWKTKNPIYIPISGAIMGLSFGFFMGVGSVVRSDDEYLDTNHYELLKINEEWQMRVLEADWKRKYRI
ncbi:unnamed protein product [Blepharisma stoltei]|uniref:Transmembrane protein n=1 Tax=Blepharisma stoltei TaxID=1481888 RepID=A0AAU9J6A3_9CILI|nr:unnamed protein product [Blepharisma stoltei]